MINKESTTIANERQGKKLERFSIEILTAAHRLPRSIALDRPVSCRSLLIVDDRCLIISYELPFSGQYRAPGE